MLDSKSLSLSRTQSGGAISRQQAGSKLYSPEFGMAPKRTTVYVKTFGWPMGAVLQDYFGVPEGAF